MSKLPPHLQNLTDELAADKNSDIEESIATSPLLRQLMTQAVEAGQLKHIRLTPPGANEGGHYDDLRNAIYINPGTFTDYKKDRDRIDVLTSTLGHETGHALNAKASEKTGYFVTAQITDEIRAAGTNGAVDLTPYFAMHQRSARTDEATAEMHGWDALNSRIAFLNGGVVSREEMLKRAMPTTQCVTGSDNHPQLASGIILDADMSMSNTRLPKAGPINLEPVAVCHFDQSASTLGSGGKANYANYYGAYLIQMIGQDTSAWVNPPTIKLDMNALGLRKDQLESTGLNLGGQSMHVVDISNGGYKPVVVRHSGSGVKGAPEEDMQAEQRPAPALMSEPGHPANHLWLQARSAMADLMIDTPMSRHERECGTASVVAGALCAEGWNISRIDRIDPSTHIDPQTGRPQYLIPGQGNPTSEWYTRAPVDFALAVSTPVEQSSDVAKTALQTRELALLQEQQLALTKQQEAPAGPVMRIGARTVSPSSNAGSEGGGGG